MNPRALHPVRQRILLKQYQKHVLQKGGGGKHANEEICDGRRNVKELTDKIVERSRKKIWRTGRGFIAPLAGTGRYLDWNGKEMSRIKILSSTIIKFIDLSCHARKHYRRTPPPIPSCPLPSSKANRNSPPKAGTRTCKRS
jgi:hypothetical protein